MASSNKRQRDSENAKRLPPSPNAWRNKPQTWPYHNNLGTVHTKPKDEEKK